MSSRQCNSQGRWVRLAFWAADDDRNAPNSSQDAALRSLSTHDPGMSAPVYPRRRRWPGVHILPCPRFMVWRMAGAVTLSDIWMFQTSLSPCAQKSANSFGIAETSRSSRSAQTETSRDVLERGPAEYRQAVVDAVGAQLVNLSIRTLHRSSRRSACACHDGAPSQALGCGTAVRRRPRIARVRPRHPACGRRLRRGRRKDRFHRAEFADRCEALRRPPAHLRVEIGLMAGPVTMSQSFGITASTIASFARSRNGRSGR